MPLHPVLDRWLMTSDAHREVRFIREGKFVQVALIQDGSGVGLSKPGEPPREADSAEIDLAKRVLMESKLIVDAGELLEPKKA